MRFIGYNIVPICFLALAAFLVWMQVEGWRWCIFGAIMTAVSPGKDIDAN